MRLPAFICLSVSITQKRVHGFGWNVACRQMSGHGPTDKLLSPIRIIARMPEPDCFLRYRISHATRNFTSGKSDVYALVAAARHGFKMVLRPTAAATRDYRSMHMHKRGICGVRPSVRRSVCPSRSGVAPKRIKISSKFFSPSGSDTILVFPYETG